MVRETRYLWVGNLPDKVTEDRISERFQSYGKIQSVKFIEDENGKAAIVAFMDIKSASKAHSTENKLDGNILHTEYSEASGGGVKVTRSYDQEGTARPAAAPGPRYGGSKQGYSEDGRPAYSGYRDSYEGGRRDGSGERWQQQGGGGGSYYGGGGQERGRPRTRYPPPNAPGYYQQGVRGAQYEGQYGQQYSGDKYAQRQKSNTTQSPAQSESSGTSSRQKQRVYRPRSGSKSRSSSSGSSGSRSTSTSHSHRSGGKRKSGRSVVVQARREDKPDQHLGVLLRGFPARSSDTSLRDGLFHEYKKFGKVMSVSIKGEKENRFAIVTFKKHEDARKALEAAREKSFFGKKVQAEPHGGVEDNESTDVFRPPEADLDEYHHKATRTLFVGNLTKDSTKEELKAIFRCYGVILDIDIKNQQPNQVFAFVQFDNIKSVVQALHEMDGENIGTSKVKLGFGRSMPTNVLWVDNITEQTQESYLKRQFSRNGPANYVLVDRTTCRALVFYDNNELAMQSLSTMRGRVIGNVKIQIDFASAQCMNALMDNMESTGQLRPEDRPDQKGFRQYHGEQQYEDKNWYGQYGGGGRGKFRGSAGYYRQGGRQYYEQGYEQDPSYSSSKKRYEGNYEDADYPESYERESRSYGYSQKERIEVRASTPSYVRSEKHESHPDDYRREADDVDRDSSRGYRREKYTEERYEEKPRVKAARAYSPSNSEVSHKSSQRQRSLSASPERSRQSSRDKRAFSPGSPVREGYRSSSRHSSPESNSPRKPFKDTKSKSDRSKELPKSYQVEDVDFKPSTSLMSEIQRTRPRKHSLKRESDTDLTDLDKALQKGDLFGSPPLKRQAMEEEVEKSRREHDTTEYRRKLNYDEAAHRRASGSHSLDYSGAIVQDKYRDGSRTNYPDSRTAQLPGQEPEIESKFSTPSPSTKSTKSESDKTPDSSERNSGSHSSGDITLLEKEKQRLLSELQEMSSNGSVSDGEIQDEDDKQKKKKPRLEDVFDLNWSPSEGSMAKWREQAKKLEREGQLKEGWENDQPKNSRTEPPPKPPEGDAENSQAAKFKPIDTKKSYRKQMEAMRKEQEQETAPSTESRGSNSEHNSRDSDMDTNDGGAAPGSEGSEKSPSSEFRKKNGADKSKGQRSYRTTCTDEMSFGTHASGDEYEVASKRRISHYKKREEVDKASSKDTKEVSRMDTTEPKSSRKSDIDSKVDLKSPVSGHRRESTESKHGHEQDRSRRSSKDNYESSAQKKDSHSRKDRSSEKKKRSEPAIIPDQPDSKRPPIDPRKPRENTESDQVSLPLPKFAEKYMRKGGSGRHTPKSSSHLSPSHSHSKRERRDSSTDKSRRDSSTEKVRRDSSADKGRRDSSAEKPRRDSSIEKARPDSSTDKSHLDTAQTDSSAKVTPTEKIASTVPEDMEGDIFTDNSIASKLEAKLAKRSETRDPMDTDESKLKELEIKEALISEIKTESTAQDTTTCDKNNSASDNLDSEKTDSSVDKETAMDTRPQDSSVESVSNEQSEKEMLKDKQTDLNISDSIAVDKENTDKKPGADKQQGDVDNSVVERDKTEADIVSPVTAQDLNSAAKSERSLDKTSDIDSADNSDKAERPVLTLDCSAASGAMDKDQSKDAPKSASTPVSLASPAKSLTPRQRETSDSDLSDLDTSGGMSIDERLRAIDEKLNLVATNEAMKRMASTENSTPTTPTSSSLDYRDKYRVRKKEPFGSLSASHLAQADSNLENKGEHSDIVKSLLSRSSIFDQDTKRLDRIDEKYQPKSYLNSDKPTVFVGSATDDSNSSIDSRVRGYFTEPMTPNFDVPSSYSIGSPLTFAPPGSIANKEEKIAPQSSLNRYPFLNKKSSGLDIQMQGQTDVGPSMSAPPVLAGLPRDPRFNPTSPTTAGLPRDPRRDPTSPTAGAVSRDPRRDPTSPPVVMPPSILKKSPITSPTTLPLVRKADASLTTPPALTTSMGRKMDLDTPPSILKKADSSSSLASDKSPPPSILKKSENNTDVSSDLTKSQNSSSIGTGHNATKNNEPETSAVPKNEVSLGDGTQYQSTPSPPVLTKEVKGPVTQGNGTVNPLKRKFHDLDDIKASPYSETSEPPKLSTECDAPMPMTDGCMDDVPLPQLTVECPDPKAFKEKQKDVESPRSASESKKEPSTPKNKTGKCSDEVTTPDSTKSKSPPSEPDTKKPRLSEPKKGTDAKKDKTSSSSSGSKSTSGSKSQSSSSAKSASSSSSGKTVVNGKSGSGSSSSRPSSTSSGKSASHSSSGGSNKSNSQKDIAKRPSSSQSSKTAPKVSEKSGAPTADKKPLEKSKSQDKPKHSTSSSSGNSSSKSKDISSQCKSSHGDNKKDEKPQKEIKVKDKNDKPREKSKDLLAKVDKKDSPKSDKTKDLPTSKTEKSRDSTSASKLEKSKDTSSNKDAKRDKSENSVQLEQKTDKKNSSQSSDSKMDKSKAQSSKHEKADSKLDAKPRESSGLHSQDKKKLSHNSSPEKNKNEKESNEKPKEKTKLDKSDKIKVKSQEKNKPSESKPDSFVEKNKLNKQKHEKDRNVDKPQNSEPKVHSSECKTNEEKYRSDKPYKQNLEPKFNNKHDKKVSTDKAKLDNKNRTKESKLDKESKANHKHDKTDRIKNNNRIDKSKDRIKERELTEKKKSPTAAPKQERSESMSSLETRELKMLRDALGAEAWLLEEQQSQFTSMYDSIKRRSCRVDSQSNKKSADDFHRQFSDFKRRRRGSKSIYSSDANSDSSNDDSHFSSDNKENRKKQNRSKPAQKRRSFISSSSDMSSSSASESEARQKPKPVLNSTRPKPSKKKSVLSDSSSDESDVDVSVKPKSKPVANSIKSTPAKKKVSAISNSSGSDSSDSEDVLVKPQKKSGKSVKKIVQSESSEHESPKMKQRAKKPTPSKPSVTTKAKVPNEDIQPPNTANKPNKEKVVKKESTKLKKLVCTDSSSDSEGEAVSKKPVAPPKKGGRKTALEKLESSLFDDISSDDSDGVKVQPLKPPPTEEKKPKAIEKKKSPLERSPAKEVKKFSEKTPKKSDELKTSENKRVRRKSVMTESEDGRKHTTASSSGSDSSSSASSGSDSESSDTESASPERKPKQNGGVKTPDINNAFVKNMSSSLLFSDKVEKTIKPQKNNIKKPAPQDHMMSPKNKAQKEEEKAKASETDEIRESTPSSSKASEKVTPLKARRQSKSDRQSRESASENDLLSPEHDRSSSSLCMSEEEKGREEKASKMHSIFSKSADNIFEKIGSDVATPQSESQSELPPTPTMESPATSGLDVPPTPSLDAPPTPNIESDNLDEHASPLFDSSDSENEPSVKLPQPLLSQDDSQDSGERLKDSANVGVTPEKVQRPITPDVDFDSPKPRQEEQEKPKKKEEPVSEPVKNTVVETEKAVKSLECLLDDIPAPTIIETNIIANVEIGEDVSSEGASTNKVNDDEMANAILSICGGGPEPHYDENPPIEEVASVVYTQPSDDFGYDTRESEQAVAGLYGCEMNALEEMENAVSALQQERQDTQVQEPEKKQVLGDSLSMAPFCSLPDPPPKRQAPKELKVDKTTVPEKLKNELVLDVKSTPVETDTLHTPKKVTAKNPDSSSKKSSEKKQPSEKPKILSPKAVTKNPEPAVPKDLENLVNALSEYKEQAKKVIETKPANKSKIENSVKLEAEKIEAKINSVDNKAKHSDLKTYSMRSNLTTVAKPKEEMKPLPKPDFDKEKETDEEIADTSVYVKEPERVRISIEDLNDFEDEEDLPDLIIDETPTPKKKSPPKKQEEKKVGQGEEVMKTPEVPAVKESPKEPVKSNNTMAISRFPVPPPQRYPPPVIPASFLPSPLVSTTACPTSVPSTVPSSVPISRPPFEPRTMQSLVPRPTPSFDLKPPFQLRVGGPYEARARAPTQQQSARHAYEQNRMPLFDPRAIHPFEAAKAMPRFEPRPMQQCSTYDVKALAGLGKKEMVGSKPISVPSPAPVSVATAVHIQMPALPTPQSASKAVPALSPKLTSPGAQGAVRPSPMLSPVPKGFLPFNGGDAQNSNAHGVKDPKKTHGPQVNESHKGLAPVSSEIPKTFASLAGYVANSAAAQANDARKTLAPVVSEMGRNVTVAGSDARKNYTAPGSELFKSYALPTTGMPPNSYVPTSVASKSHTPPNSTAPTNFTPPNNGIQKSYTPPNSALLKGFPSDGHRHAVPNVFDFSNLASREPPRIYAAAAPDGQRHFAAASESQKSPPTAGLQKAFTPPSSDVLKSYAPPPGVVQNSYSTTSTAVRNSFNPAPSTVQKNYTPPSKEVQQSFTPQPSELPKGHTPPSMEMKSFFHPPTELKSHKPTSIEAQKRCAVPSGDLPKNHTPLSNEIHTISNESRKSVTAPSPPALQKGFVQPSSEMQKGYTPPSSLQQKTYAPPSSTVPRSGTLPCAAVSKSYSPPAVQDSKSYTPPAAPVSTSYTPPAAPVSTSYTPPAAPVSTSYTLPATAVSKSYTPPAAPVSTSYTPPAAPVSTSYTLPAAAVSKSYTPPAAPVSKSYTPPAAPVSTSYTAPAALVSKSYIAPVVADSKGYTTLSTQVHQNYSPPVSAVSQTPTLPAAEEPRNYTPPVNEARENYTPPGGESQKPASARSTVIPAVESKEDKRKIGVIPPPLNLDDDSDEESKLQIDIGDEELVIEPKTAPAVIEHVTKDSPKLVHPKKAHKFNQHNHVAMSEEVKHLAERNVKTPEPQTIANHVAPETTAEPSVEPAADEADQLTPKKRLQRTKGKKVVSGGPTETRSPVTRGKAKQEETVVSPPTTPKEKSANTDGAEKFSSRGRKIIPKERGDEMLAPKTRKGRRNAAGTPTVVSTENEGLKMKFSKKVVSPVTTQANAAETQGEGGKTWSLRSKKDAAEAEPPIPEPVKEPAKEPPIKLTLKRTRRGRRATTTIQKTTAEEKCEEKPAEPEPVKEEEQEEPVPITPATKKSELPQRPRRTKKIKVRKPSDIPSPQAPRVRKPDGSVSPRSKSADSSPKDLNKSYVKLDKINVEQMIKEGRSDKDLYEWQDEEEKPLPGLKTARATRKRKNSDSESPTKDQQARKEDNSQPSTKKQRANPGNPKKDAIKKAEEEAKKAEEGESSKVEEELEPEPRKPDMNDILQGNRGHLPLKLAMKWESHEAARREREAKEAAAKAAEEAAKSAEAREKADGSWRDHLDKVIEEVSKGHFDEESRTVTEDFPQPSKESPVAANMAGPQQALPSGVAPKVTSPPSGVPASAAVGIMPPTVISPHLTTAAAVRVMHAHRQTPPNSNALPSAGHHPGVQPITVAVASAPGGVPNAQQLSPHSVRGAPSPHLNAPPHGFPGAHLIPPPAHHSPVTSTSSQSSELRAALAQPSKLVKQEKLLRGTASQHSPIDARIAPSPHEPRPATEHHVPLTLQDPPRSRANSKSDHRPTSTPGSGTVTPHDLHASRAETLLRHPELGLAVPQMHGDVRPNMLLPSVYHPGHYAGMQFMQLQARMPDPRIMPHPVDMSHPEVAHQMIAAGLIPPSLMAAQLPTQQDGRPPSHPAAPHASAPQPSPRTGAHHSPQVSTPLTPQLPIPPMAALPSRQALVQQGREMPPLDVMFSTLQRYPVMWQGHLYLKNDSANVQLHFVTGNKALVNGALGTAMEHIVRISQRMRLEPTQLEGVAKRMQKEEEYSMLIAVPTGKDHIDILHQSSKLQSGFIHYLQQKQAAGIVNVPNPVQAAFVVHIFPPCDFSTTKLQLKAPELLRNLNDNHYLAIVITST